MTTMPALPKRGSLEDVAIARWDFLQAEGRLFFEQTEPELVKSSGFKVDLPAKSAGYQRVGRIIDSS
jgi:hypothetical protein